MESSRTNEWEEGPLSSLHVSRSLSYYLSIAFSHPIPFSHHCAQWYQYCSSLISYLYPEISYNAGINLAQHFLYMHTLKNLLPSNQSRNGGLSSSNLSRTSASDRYSTATFFLSPLLHLQYNAVHLPCCLSPTRFSCRNVYILCTGISIQRKVSRKLSSSLTTFLGVDTASK